MILNDPELREIVSKGTKVEINNNKYIVKTQRTGSCDGCAFEEDSKCPTLARRYCCSNGGNILKLSEQNNK